MGILQAQAPLGSGLSATPAVQIEDGDGDEDVEEDEEDGEKKNYDDDDDYKANGDDEDDLPALVAQQCEPIEASPVGHTCRNLPQT